MMLAFSAAWLITATGLQDASPGPKVDIVERIGRRLPVDLTFQDSDGQRVQLRELLSKVRPTILSFVYHRCEALCGLMLRGMVAALQRTGLGPGVDFDLVTVSVDPTEPEGLAAEKKRGYLRALGYPDRPEAWRFLGGDESTVRALAGEVGFVYSYDREVQQYAHAAVLVLVSPEHTISRYLYGVRFEPRELKKALVDASQGKVGTTIERFIMRCFRSSASAVEYAGYISTFFKAGAVVLLLGVGLLLRCLWTRERARLQPDLPAVPAPVRDEPIELGMEMRRLADKPRECERSNQIEQLFV